MTTTIPTSNPAVADDPRNIRALIGAWVKPSREHVVEHRIRNVSFLDGKLRAYCGRSMNAFATIAGVCKPGDIHRCAVCEDSESKDENENPA